MHQAEIETQGQGEADGPSWGSLQTHLGAFMSPSSGFLVCCLPYKTALPTSWAPDGSSLISSP